MKVGGHAGGDDESRQDRRERARMAFGIVAVTAVVALLQILSSNRADAEGEGSWIMPSWVYEEEEVVDGTFPFRVSETRVIQVPPTASATTGIPSPSLVKPRRQ